MMVTHGDLWRSIDLLVNNRLSVSGLARSGSTVRPCEEQTPAGDRSRWPRRRACANS